jgi:DNA-binding MarR family transcriptional regulator
VLSLAVTEVKKNVKTKRKNNLNTKSYSPSANFELWLLVGRISHSINLIRQRELMQFRIPVRQLHVLHLIHDLGSKATLTEVAKQAERNGNVISRQTVVMERDGLVKRIKDVPKSNSLRFELTKKGIDLVNTTRQSKKIERIFSALSEEQRQELKQILNEIAVKVRKYG